MNPRVKIQWAEALRSNNYEQTNGQLYHPCEGYCCLGVLADLYIRDKGKSVIHMPDTDYEVSIHSVSVNGLGELPSDDVLNWAELTLEEAKELAELNDNGATFQEIAVNIELNL